MKIYITLFFISFSAFCQDSNLIKTPDPHKKLSIGIVGGTYGQFIERNEQHLTNLYTYTSGIHADYRIGKLIYLKTGFNSIRTVSFSGFSYDSYNIPLLLGGYIFSGEHKNSDISLIGEFGPFFRGISNFSNSTSIDYSKNNVFGIQFSFTVKYDVSNNLFTILSLRTNRDFDDILQAENNNIRVQGSYSLELGFGFKFL